MNLKIARTIILLITISFCSLNILAQPQSGGSGNYSGNMAPIGSIKGAVINSVDGKPLAYAYIRLFKLADSSLVNGGISDSLGKFSIEKIPFGKYYMTVTLLGHKSVNIDLVLITPKEPNKILDAISLDAGATTLQTFEVTEKKQAVEYSLDKKIINVDKALVSTGGNAIDVMQSIPSVTVDIDGNLSMRGNSNVTVLVDGKPSALSSSTILEQIPASSIETIEVISNPSSKYDPDGMTGIINIVLKKKKEKGYNGLVTLNAGTGDRYSGSIALNYSKNKINLFSNYDFRSFYMKGWSDFERELTFNDTTTYLLSEGVSGRKRLSHSIKLGTDYYINSKNTITISGTYNIGEGRNWELEKSTKLNYNELFSNYYENNDTETDERNTIDLMLNYKKSFKNKGEYITFDANYSTSDELETELNSLQYYLSDISTHNGFPINQQNSTDEKSTLTSLQTDYTFPFSKNGRFEAGAKSIFREIDNDYQVLLFSNTTNSWIKNLNLSNRFIYDEQIHAAYATYANSKGSFEYSAGLRIEKAFTKSNQKTTNQEFSKDYFSLFPTLHINLKLENDNSLQASYSRRVNRPRYFMLNPFVDESEPGFRSFGNPYLMPEYIDSYELGHIKYWKNSSLNSSIFYKKINNAVQRTIFFDSLGVQNMTFDNISAGISYGLEFVASYDIAKWWKINTTFSYFRTIMEGTEGDQEISNSNYSWTAKLNSSISLMKNLDIQVIGNYRAPMVQLQGTMEAMYFADLAMKKDIFKKKASISLRFSDIFKTQQFNMKRNAENYSIDMLRGRDSRSVSLGFTYRFGNVTKVKEKKKPSDNNDSNNVENEIY